MQLEQQQRAVDQLLNNTRMLEGKLAEVQYALCLGAVAGMCPSRCFVTSYGKEVLADRCL
jgi:hypothetical protein